MVTGVSDPTADLPSADACDIAIAIEKIGTNAVGKRHSVLGAPLTTIRGIARRGQVVGR